MKLSLSDKLTSQAYIIQAAVAASAAHFHLQEEGYRRVPTRTGKCARRRTRQSVAEIYNCLGPIYFRRAYRMTYASFWRLHDLLEEKINTVAAQVRGYNKKSGDGGDNNCSSPPIPNGIISSSARLGIALRYFAGGSPYDIMVKFGVSHSSVFECVWIIVQAVNELSAMKISYPSDVETQKKIARGFCNASKVKFDCCAGAIDGILIWMHKPSQKEADAAGVGQKKFLCGRKSKFGLNCQALCDVRGRFLDISITYGGSSSDCLAFEASELHKRLEEGLLADGLVIFGDNAYLNTKYMATPYPNIAGKDQEKSKDNYNFYHSQVRIRIECAFGMLVQRWGTLRMAMPKGIGLARIIALVNALAKLHNFCIDEVCDGEESSDPLLQPLNVDVNHMMNNEHGFVPMEAGADDGILLPRALMDAGHHFRDIPRNVRRQHERSNPDQTLPRQRLLQQVIDSHLKRPNVK